MINDLSGQAGQNMNQLVRWVNNKDQHADEFSHIVTYYFMAQRIKPAMDKKGAADYQNKLNLLHEMLVTAMKCKQTTDLKMPAELTALVDQFEEVYFTKKDVKHLKLHKK
jgi:hypothetical protein